MITLVVSGIFLLACKSQKETTRNVEPAVSDTTKNVQQMVLLNQPQESIIRDPFEVHSFSVVGDKLEIFVSYGGGCGSVKFDLYYTQKVLNSMPPQTVLYLGFKDDDPCRAIETQKLEFSLEPFAEAAETGGIWLILGGSELRQLYKK
jgi:hypothetical protein